MIPYNTLSNRQQYIEKRSSQLQSRIQRAITIGISGAESVRKLQFNDIPLMFTSLHKSHMDYLITLYAMNQEGIYPPRVISGANLTSGITKRIIKYLGGFDFEKAGVVSIDRGTCARSIVELADDVEKDLKENNYLIYPEGGNGCKTGRTYDGLVRDFSSLGFRIAQRAEAFIVPMAVSYDYMPELLEIPVLQDVERRKLEGEPYKMQYIASEFRTFTHHLKHPTGRVYIKFGEPFSSQSKIRDVVQQAFESATSLVEYSPTNAFATAVHNGVTDIRCVHTQAVEYARPYRIMGESDSIQAGQQLAKRGVIDFDHLDVIVKKPEIIEFLANQVAHLNSFKPELQK